MEHLSNSLNAQKASGNSAGVLANMRSGPSYNHHSSVPESVLMEQLKGVNMKGGAGHSPGLAVTAPTKAPLKSSQSRSNLPLMPELEYDPWYTNQQRYLAHQGQALNKQAHIYQKHMTEFTLRKQEAEEQVKEIERQREEQRRTMAQQQIEQ